MHRSPENFELKTPARTVPFPSFVTSPSGVNFPPTPSNLRKLRPLVPDGQPVRDLQIPHHRERDLLEIEIANLRSQLALQTMPPLSTSENTTSLLASDPQLAPMKIGSGPQLASLEIRHDPQLAPLKFDSDPQLAPLKIDSCHLPVLIQQHPPRNRGSGIGAGNPAVNVISEFADCFQLDEKQHNPKEGIFTLFEFFAHTAKRYPSLQEPFVAASKGSSLKNVARFECIFKAMKKPSGTIAAVATILAIDKFCPDIEHKIRFCLLAAASRTSQQRKLIDIRHSACPAMESKLAGTTFRDLPGMISILSGQDSVDDLVDFIVESISYVDDAPGRLELAIQDFNNLDGTKHTDCLLLFSDMQTLINNCITWMGKPHMTDWQLAEHFLKIYPQHVRAAWNEFESQPMTRIDRISLDFIEFQGYMQSVWTSAATKQRLALKSPVTVQQRIQQRSPQQQSTTPTQQAIPATASAGALQDIQICCRAAPPCLPSRSANKSSSSKRDLTTNPRGAQNASRMRKQSRLRGIRTLCAMISRRVTVTGGRIATSNTLKPRRRLILYPTNAMSWGTLKKKKNLTRTLLRDSKNGPNWVISNSPLRPLQYPTTLQRQSQTLPSKLRMPGMTFTTKTLWNWTIETTPRVVGGL